MVEATDFFAELVPGLVQWVRAAKHTPWIFLYGDLGVGKTTLTRELLGALGYAASEVQSPTFLKVLTYKNPAGELALHMDAYRIEEEREFLRLGLENIETTRVAIVEWPQKFEEFIEHQPAMRAALDIAKVLCVHLPERRISEKLF